jgi:hypothetical protein
MALKHRSPRHQRKIARPFDERMATAHHFDGAHQAPLDRVPGFRLRERHAELIRELASDPQQLAPLERGKHATLIGYLAVPLLCQLLADQPLPPRPLSSANLAPETRIADRDRRLGDCHMVKPSRGVCSRQFLKRRR